MLNAYSPQFSNYKAPRIRKKIPRVNVHTVGKYNICRNCIETSDSVSFIVYVHSAALDSPVGLLQFIMPLDT